MKIAEAILFFKIRIDELQKDLKDRDKENVCYHLVESTLACNKKIYEQLVKDFN